MNEARWYALNLDEGVREEQRVQDVCVQRSGRQPLHWHSSEIQNASVSGAAHARAIVVQSVGAQRHNLARWLPQRGASWTNEMWTEKVLQKPCTLQGMCTFHPQLLQLHEKSNAFIQHHQP
jgi:hypothetical protein